MNAKTVGDGRDVGEEIENADATAVSTDTASVPWLKPYRWKAGQSGNPGGRLGGLAQRVRQATHDGEDIVRFLVGVVNDDKEKVRDRLHAAEMLLSRGWGKAVLPVALRALIEDRLEDRRPERSAFNMDYFATLDHKTQRTFLDVLNRLLPGPVVTPR